MGQKGRGREGKRGKKGDGWKGMSTGSTFY